MKKIGLRANLAVCLVGLLVAASAMGERPLPYDEGSQGLALALRRLPVTGSLLHTAAHPDDEDNPLLVQMNRGRGFRTGLLTLTRGDGGQNEIGPELFEALGILRSGELEAMHRYDGAEQFFSTAFDFGYSFSVEETFAKWGREEILGEMVRVIRKFRPQVIISLPRGGRGGGQHHQASALLTAEAFKAAADPNRFPEQIEQGLFPWQALKLYERARWLTPPGAERRPPEGAIEMATGIFDPLLGRTYAQIGLESRSLHRCQGMGQIVPPAGERSSWWKLVDAVIPVSPDETDLFAGIDTSLKSIAGPAPAQQRPSLEAGLERIANWIEVAKRAFDSSRPSTISAPLAAGLEEVRRLRKMVSDMELAADIRHQIDFLLAGKEKDFVEALRLSRQIVVEAFADDGLVVPGQEVVLTVHVSNGGTVSLPITAVELDLPPGWEAKLLEEVSLEVPAQGAVAFNYQVQVADGAPSTEPYWRLPHPLAGRYVLENPRFAGQPWPDPIAVARVRYRTQGVEAEAASLVEYRYEGPWVGGEQRHDLMVVPQVSLRLSPETQVVPLGIADSGRKLRVTALYQGKDPAVGYVEVQSPAGWEVEPVRQPLEFERENQSVAFSFLIRPRGPVAPGDYRFTATAALDGKQFGRGYQVIDYDHIRRRHLFHPAETVLRAVDLQVAGGLRLGYIDGVGDHVPAALDQLGIDYQFLDEEDLAFGDLNRFDVIITGVRAYLVREDLRTHNSRLLSWVEQGGTLIVQYNKYEFNKDWSRKEDSPYAPFPARVSSGRITGEDTPVNILVPDHPVFRFPNPIADSDWQAWVQERGLYFLGEKSEDYRDLVSMEDPFEFNSGEKRGALVEAKYGNGRWIYVGLGLWRQLPASVPGSFRLLANLISLPASGEAPVPPDSESPRRTPDRSKR